MKKLMLTVASAALGVGIAWPASAQISDADCQKMFETADVNQDGSLGAGEVDKFLVLMSTKPKDASMVTLDEFMAECRKDSFKTVQEAAVAPAPDTNNAAKSSADENVTAEQPSTATEQPATAEQPAAGQDSSTSTTTTTEQSATAEQPAAGQDFEHCDYYHNRSRGDGGAAGSHDRSGRKCYRAIGSPRAAGSHGTTCCHPGAGGNSPNASQRVGFQADRRDSDVGR